MISAISNLTAKIVTMIDSKSIPKVGIAANVISAFGPLAWSTRGRVCTLSTGVDAICQYISTRGWSVHPWGKWYACQQSAEKNVDIASLDKSLSHVPSLSTMT